MSKVLASVSALALAVSPVAAVAAEGSSSPVERSTEAATDRAEAGGGATIIALLAAVAVAIGIIVAVDDDDEDLPVSA